MPLFVRGDWQHVRSVRGSIRRYCPVTKTGYYAPRNPHRMSIGWYLNHSAQPNVNAKEGKTQWTSLHYIPAGRELTIDYQFVDYAVTRRAV